MNKQTLFSFVNMGAVDKFFIQTPQWLIIFLIRITNSSAAIVINRTFEKIIFWIIWKSTCELLYVHMYVINGNELLHVITNFVFF